MDGSNTCWGSCQKHTLPESTLLMLLSPHLSCIREECGRESHRILTGNRAKAVHCSTQLVSLHGNHILLTPCGLCVVVMELTLQHWERPFSCPQVPPSAHGQGTEGRTYSWTHRSSQMEHEWGSAAAGQERVSFIHYKYVDLIYNGENGWKGGQT